MIVQSKHPILSASVEELKQLKAAGLQAEDIVSLRDACGYCIFGTGELVEELAKRYPAINGVFPEVFELLRWNPRTEPSFWCKVCEGKGALRVITLFICGHVAHYDCRRMLRVYEECDLKIQPPRFIRIKHSWRFNE